MSDSKFSLDNYIDVAERIANFNEKYPEGTLQTIGWTVEEIGGQLFVVYRAAAYRTPDDPRPSHGTAWEPFPGKSPYTRDSELMNAETAAWGRAIVACGLTSNRKIASRQEVQARQEDRSAPPRTAVSNGLSQETFDAIKAARQEAGVDPDWLRMQLIAVGVDDVPERVTQATVKRLSQEQGQQLLSVLNAELDLQNAGAGTDGD